MVVRLETNNGRKSLGLNRRKQSLPNHLITTNRKRTRFCHVLLMRNSLAPFKRICTISDHWGAYLILSICQKLAMEIMATNLPPTQLFSTEISTNSLTLRAHERYELEPRTDIHTFDFMFHCFSENVPKKRPESLELVILPLASPRCHSPLQTCPPCCSGS